MDSKNMGFAGLFLVIVCMSFYVFGCATTGGVVRAKEKGKGVSKIYPISAGDAWEIAKIVFRWEEIEAIEEHSGEGYMLAASEKSLVTSGIILGVWIEPMDADKTRVTVVVRTKSSTDFFAPFTEESFYDDFELAARTKVGRAISSLPLAARPLSAPREKSAASRAITPSENNETVTVEWTSANIRSGPGDDFSLVATSKRGERLTVVGEDGDWLNVRFGNGQEGWIARKKVR